MKYILIFLIAIVTISCNYQTQDKNTDNKESIIQNGNENTIPLILPSSLEKRRDELQTYLNNARINIRHFADVYSCIIQIGL